MKYYSKKKLKLNVNLIKFLDLTMNLQEIQEIEEHIKWHYVGIFSQVQIIGDSTGKST